MAPAPAGTSSRGALTAASHVVDDADEVRPPARPRERLEGADERAHVGIVRHVPRKIIGLRTPYIV